MKADVAERMSYSIREAAALTGLSVSGVQRWIRRGDVTVVRIGRRVLIPRSALRAFFDDTDQPVPRPRAEDLDTPWARALRSAEAERDR